MKLSVWRLAVSFSVIWGFAVLFSGVANMIWPGYAGEFLKMCASIYPGYHAMPSWGSVLLGTGYALADGFGGGAVLALIYNATACLGRHTPPPVRPA